MKMLIKVIVLVCFCLAGPLALSQVKEEPDFKQCPSGYIEVTRVDGGLLADREPNQRTHQIELGCLSELLLLGWTAEGHPEIPECSIEGGPGEPSACNQLQDFENYEVDLDGVIFGDYIDSLSSAENAWFDAGPWTINAEPGTHDLRFSHTLEGDTPESVFYKITVCAKCSEPNFPECPEGYITIAQLGGGGEEGLLRGDIEPTSRTHVIGVPCDANLLVVGFAKEGHPENPGCSPEGGPGEPSVCNQFQDYENFVVALDGSIFGQYTDDLGPIENAWFPAGPWVTDANQGQHELMFIHTQEGEGAQSVHYKVSVCAKCDRPAQGCTPGFFKNIRKHLDEWVGYSPRDNFNAVFGVRAFDRKNLYWVLRKGGGGKYALGRHAVAALLSAANPDVDYLYTEEEVIEMVREAFRTGDFETIKDLLKEQNEKGCPL